MTDPVEYWEEQLQEVEAERDLARQYLLACAERLHGVAEILSIKAERKTRRNETMTKDLDAGVLPFRPKGIEGVGPDAPVVVNEAGGKQSGSPYRSDLLPPDALLAVAKVLKEGADKYGDNNWRRIKIPDHLNHALTHVLAWLAGDGQDDHLEHAACRLLFALDLKRIDDRVSESIGTDG